MGKISFNDITPPKQTGSIRDVDLSSENRRERQERRAARRIQNPTDDFNNQDETHYSPKKNRNPLLVWGSVLVLFLGLSIIVVLLFIGKTTIQITARSASVPLSSNVVQSAYRAPEELELGFKTISKTIEESKTIKATKVEHVEKTASGKITVYNKYSRSGQRLIKNTRFETPDGKIYRVHNSFIVPGKDAVGNPGRIDVVVYADKAGEEYNIENTRLTIPGLKGGPRFDGFYAEVATAISGGFSGERPTIEDAELDSARNDLKLSLETKALSAIKKEALDNQILFKETVFTEFSSDDTQADSDAQSILLTAKLKISAFVFDKNAFAEEISNDGNSTLHEGDKTVQNADAISFELVQKDEIDPANDEMIQFTVNGSSEINWDIDKNSLRQDLAGQPSSSLDQTLSKYPGIKDAYATIRPFWQSTFPSDIGSIELNINTSD